MRILFLDQSGKPGGAELCLIDIAKPYRDTALVSLFADGSFKSLLEENKILVEVIGSQKITVGKDSNFIQSISSLAQIIPLIIKVAAKAKKYDLIYANTQKALVIGAMASFLSRRPLVYHLHDILSQEHFSQSNLTVAVKLANWCTSLVIANSQASKTAFLQAGGLPEISEVVYNGFSIENYQSNLHDIQCLRQELGVEDKFLVGNFSRLAPWKGQHILIEALGQCSPDVTTILVGDALFGEEEYVKQLHYQVAQMGLESRVKFLGFRADIPRLMAACNLVAHTSTAPEPFGRVIVEAMLCGRPVVATRAGGALELVEHGVNGFLVTPASSPELAKVINTCVQQPEMTTNLANYAKVIASERFDITRINQQIAQLLQERIK